MLTEEADGGQVPLEMVQVRLLTPADNPVMVELGSDGSVITALPLLMVQTPVPTTAESAARVVVVAAQIS